MSAALEREAEARRASPRPESSSLTEAVNPDNRNPSIPSPRQSRSCVIVVENLPVPFDRRVWQEAQALNAAGWRVSVICPSNDDFPEPFEIIDDIAIYRHPLPPEGQRLLAVATAAR